MSRKRQAGGNPPSVIQVVGGAGFPMPGLPAVAPTMIMDPLSSTLSLLNSNPYLIGIFYLFLNLGGRFLSLELTKRQEWFLAQSYVRPFILFAVMFISTRNLAVAFWTTVGILSVLWLFANENSAFCLIPGWKEKAPENNYDVNMNKLKKTEIPEDGNHDPITVTGEHPVAEHPVAEHPVAEHPVDEHPATAIPSTEHHLSADHKEVDDHPKDNYVNVIKEDPVPNNNIKEHFASY